MNGVYIFAEVFYILFSMPNRPRCNSTPLAPVKTKLRVVIGNKNKNKQTHVRAKKFKVRHLRIYTCQRTELFFAQHLLKIIQPKVDAHVLRRLCNVHKIKSNAKKAKYASC